MLFQVLFWAPSHHASCIVVVLHTLLGGNVKLVPPRKQCMQAAVPYTPFPQRTHAMLRHTVRVWTKTRASIFSFPPPHPGNGICILVSASTEREPNSGPVAQGGRCHVRLVRSVRSLNLFHLRPSRSGSILHRGGRCRT
jgi:hypothetical protein